MLLSLSRWAGLKSLMTAATGVGVVVFQGIGTELNCG